VCLCLAGCWWCITPRCNLASIQPSFACTHTHTHTCTYKLTNARMHARTHARTHAHAHKDTRIHTHAHTYSHTYKQIYTPTRTNTHTHTHVHTHPRAQLQTHQPRHFLADWRTRRSKAEHLLHPSIPSVATIPTAT